MTPWLVAIGSARPRFTDSGLRHGWAAGVCLLLMVSVVGCDAARTRGGGDDRDDPDAAADSDGDGDSDSDSGGDSDTAEDEEQLPCPMNSGWPCACNNPGGSCDDESACLVVADIGNENIGVCFRYCEADDTDPDIGCPETAFPASEECIGVYLGVGAEQVCGLLCEDMYDCPVFQGCKETGSTVKLCHP